MNGVPRLGGSASPRATVVQALLARGVLSSDEGGTQGGVASGASVSHRSTRIDVGGEPRLFVKQADPVRSGGRNLAVEAAVYRIAQRSQPLAQVVPTPRFVSDDDATIVLDAVPGTPLSSLPESP